MSDHAALTFGSLFAGIGGFDLGFERAGMTCQWQVEIDPFCQKVLAKHWPNVERFSDVRECGKHNLSAVDVVCGGFPCQPHSVAGKRKGAADDRDLWPEYRRVVAELRPRYVVAENVPGIRSTMLDQVLSDLEGMAYTVATLIVPACAFDAPHRRERVFIMANTEHIRCSICTPTSKAEWDPGAAYNGKCSPRHELRSGENVADAKRIAGFENEQTSQSGRANVGQYCTGWLPEPDVGRVAHGIPQRVDRLRALGNAVVPQVAEWIGRRIVEVA